LGFAREELVAAPEIEIAGGQTVAAFSPPEQVFGQVRVDQEDATYLWGPEFVLQARFVPHEDNLLGRVDFFNAFNIVFSAAGPTMHIYEL
jgi:hypothetical protein